MKIKRSEKEAILDRRARDDETRTLQRDKLENKHKLALDRIRKELFKNKNPNDIGIADEKIGTWVVFDGVESLGSVSYQFCNQRAEIFWIAVGHVGNTDFKIFVHTHKGSIKIFEDKMKFKDIEERFHKLLKFFQTY